MASFTHLQQIGYLDIQRFFYYIFKDLKLVKIHQTPNSEKSEI